jgi:hypothetical protein
LRVGRDHAQQRVELQQRPALAWLQARWVRAAIWQPCSRKTRQTDSTAQPSARMVSMKPMITGCGVTFPHEESRCRTKDFDILTQPPVLGLQALDLSGFLGRDPARAPPSTSAWITHRRTDSLPTPSCLATAAAAAVSEGYSPR